MLHQHVSSTPAYRRQNVGTAERWASMILGSGLLLNLARDRSPASVAAAALGAALVHRGATGTCMLYSALGVSTAEAQGEETTSVPYGYGIRVDRAVTIGKPAAELYRFWRKLENLPKIMRHLEEVRATDAVHSHWVAKGPAGSKIEWDAEIINEVENELIGWRSTNDAEVANAGSVHFRELPAGRGTEVHVILRYDPPGGKIGAAIAKLLGEEPSIQIADDLRRFKQLMETGEIATTEGQPAGER